jgi:hypothetical protein
VRATVHIDGAYIDGGAVKASAGASAAVRCAILTPRISADPN